MTEEDQIIEAIARAIWQAHEDRNPIRFTKQTWEQGSVTARLFRLDDARAAYRALQEREAGK